MFGIKVKACAKPRGIVQSAGREIFRFIGRGLASEPAGFAAPRLDYGFYVRRLKDLLKLGSYTDCGSIFLQEIVLWFHHVHRFMMSCCKFYLIPGYISRLFP